MSEIVELYFEIAYRLIGRIVYGKEFSNQSSVPLYVKVIVGLLPLIAIVLTIWIVIELTN